MAQPKILAFATKGTGTNEELRMRTLLRELNAEFLPFDKSAKPRSFFELVRSLLRAKAPLVVMEGTGIAGGAACLLARLLAGSHYVVSSGDAVGPFIAAKHPLLGPIFAAYERVLYKASAGFIGWTPYLVGRALTFGAPRAMTAPGWSGAPQSCCDRAESRRRVRAELGIAQDAIVFGLVGSLTWNSARQYCYGLELVRALERTARRDVVALVVGDGTGLPRLREAAGDRLGKSVVLPGARPAEQVLAIMYAMDVGSLPQSVDRVGSFRYTTKLSEYLAAGLPVVTGQIPLAYDLDDGWLWRLPGDAPWSNQYVDALAQLIDAVTEAQIAQRQRAVAGTASLFDVERQVRGVTAFIQNIQAELATAPRCVSTSSTQQANATEPIPDRAIS